MPGKQSLAEAVDNWVPVDNSCAPRRGAALDYAVAGAAEAVDVLADVELELELLDSDLLDEPASALAGVVAVVELLLEPERESVR